MPAQPRPKTRPWVSHRCQAILIVALFGLTVAGSILAGTAQTRAMSAVDPAAPEPTVSPLRTDNPRDLYSTFLRLSDEMEDALLAYTARHTLAGAKRLALLSDQMVALIDLDSVPSVSRREVGIETATYLMDIFGRIDPPDPASVPDQDGLEREGTETHRIAGTPLRIVRIAEGDREGEYLFSASTVQAAPRFLRGLMDRPLRTRLDIESYSAFSPQLTGPLIPAAMVRGMPGPLKGLWLGTPVWKILAIGVLAAVLVVGIALLQRILQSRAPRSPLGAVTLRAILPLAILAAVTIALPYVSHQINLSGAFAEIIEKGETVVAHAAYAWLFWLVVRMLFEWVILSPRIPDQSLDANLLRLVSGVIGIIGAAVILAFGGQAIGLPILSILAGLGIGGLAVALALRPTLENLVGGVMLYFDRPVRVGDFCSFGDQKGTVEGIGIRSTKLRALDRTLISVPNAQFADMQIINWAECDQMLINETIGVRYETEPDQLRYLLARLREMLHSHPRIDSDTVRVRFAGYGSSTLDINIRVYAETREWNDFFAIREDVFLRIYDIVTDSGTGFAFPSQTLYMARDDGLDAARGDAAKATVDRWRKEGKLPFPRLPRDAIERLEGTLDYPPTGSPETAGEDPQDAIGAERLSRASDGPDTEEDPDAALPVDEQRKR